MVKEGSFREDLYFRLSALKLRLPALREKLEDVPALVNHLLSEHGSKRKFGDLPATDQALLLDHRWPGNVRELRNVVERLLAFSAVPSVGLLESEPVTTPDLGSSTLSLSAARERATDAFERKYLKDVLARASSNVS